MSRRYADYNLLQQQGSRCRADQGLNYATPRAIKSALQRWYGYQQDASVRKRTKYGVANGHFSLARDIPPCEGRGGCDQEGVEDQVEAETLQLVRAAASEEIAHKQECAATQNSKPCRSPKPN
jgi:hypothetical protein